MVLSTGGYLAFGSMCLGGAGDDTIVNAFLQMRYVLER